MSENYEVHFKDQWIGISMKAPGPKFVEEWWKRLEKKLKRGWGLGPKKPLFCRSAMLLNVYEWRAA